MGRERKEGTVQEGPGERGKVRGEKKMIEMEVCPTVGLMF